MRSSRLGSLVLLLALVLVFGIVAMVMRVVTPPAPSAELPSRAPLTTAPLTKRLVFVLLDGVRYDVATDGRRMPKLSDRFRSHANAELFAEPISMTASAALVFGTGAHAEIDQAIRNETSQATLFEDVFTIARKARLRTGTVGDPVWTGLYPTGWDVTRADPHVLAVGVSDDEAAFLSAEALQATEPPVDFALFHFANPDHMAHGFGIASSVYEKYMASFDARLATLLDRFSPDTTVIVLGDHGATMSGIHGSDTEEQRRTFMLAYGPGIVPGPRSLPRVDDIDLAPTMAALLGVPVPRHARGAPLVSWLDAPDDVRARMACANLHDLARTLGPTAESTSLAPACEESRSAASRIAAALPIARELDTRTSEANAAAQRRGFSLSLFAAGLTAVLSFLLFYRSLSFETMAWSGLAFAVAVVIGVFLTANLEKLPGAYLTPARVSLYVLCNAPLLFWILVPVPTSRIVERATILAPVLFPGVLVLTETHSALTEAYLLSAVLVGFALTRGIPTSKGFPWAWTRPAPSRMALYGPPLLAVSVVCVDAGNFSPGWLLAAPGLQLGLALVSLVAFAAFRFIRLRPSLAMTALCTVVAAVSLVLRRSAPASVGLAGWGLVAVLAAVALYRRQRAYAELLAFGSYAWVSRDLEVPLFLASYVVAVGFGETVGKRLAEEEATDKTSRILTLSIVAFAFAWGFVQLAGIQLGMHFMHLDFAAGTFRDLGVSMPRIVLALVYKYAVARGFLLFGLLLPLPRPMRLLAIRSLVALYALRATVLVASLEAARTSFWTPVWVTSELPHVLLALLMVAVAYALAREPRSLDEALPHV